MAHDVQAALRRLQLLAVRPIIGDRGFVLILLPVYAEFFVSQSPNLIEILPRHFLLIIGYAVRWYTKSSIYWGYSSKSIFCGFRNFFCITVHFHGFPNTGKGRLANCFHTVTNDDCRQ